MEDSQNEEGLRQPTLHFHVQKAVIGSIIMDALPKLKSLSLMNIIAIDDAAYALTSFRRVTSSLESLTLSVITPYSIDDCDSHFTQESKAFWFSTIPNSFLIPAQNSLTSLSLTNDNFVGAIEEFDIHQFYFPHLASLTLGHFVFGWYAAEEFIIEHNTTLRRLELRDCAVYYDTRSWSDIWDRLLMDQTGLEELVMSDIDLECCNTQCYVYLRGGKFHIYEESKDQEEMDLAALDRLQTALELRRPRQLPGPTFLDRWIRTGKGI